MIDNSKSNLRSRLGYLERDEIQERITSGALDQYDVVLVKDQDTAAYIAPDGTIHDIISRINAYVSERTAVRALNSSPTTYVGMPVAIYYQGSYKLYLANGEPGDWEVLPAWGNPTGVYYDDLIGAPVLNKTGTIDEPLVLNQLVDGMYAVNGIVKLTSDSPTSVINSQELVIIKDNGTSIQRLSGKDSYSYTIEGGEVIEAQVTTDAKVNEMIDEQFNERLEETSSESIQNLFN